MYINGRAGLGGTNHEKVEPMLSICSMPISPGSNWALTNSQQSSVVTVSKHMTYVSPALQCEGRFNISIMIHLMGNGLESTQFEGVGLGSLPPPFRHSSFLPSLFVKHDGWYPVRSVSVCDDLE
jgi:hypothetical protein